MSLLMRRIVLKYSTERREQNRWARRFDTRVCLRPEKRLRNKIMIIRTGINREYYTIVSRTIKTFAYIFRIKNVHISIVFLENPKNVRSRADYDYEIGTERFFIYDFFLFASTLSLWNSRSSLRRCTHILTAQHDFSH